MSWLQGADRTKAYPVGSTYTAIRSKGQGVSNHPLLHAFLSVDDLKSFLLEIVVKGIRWEVSGSLVRGVGGCVGGSQEAVNFSVQNRLMESQMVST